MGGKIFFFRKNNFFRAKNLTLHGGLEQTSVGYSVIYFIMSADICYHECWYTQSWEQIHHEIYFWAHTQIWGPIHSKGKKSKCDSTHWPQFNEYNFHDSDILLFCKSKIGVFRNFASYFFHFDLGQFWYLLRPKYESQPPQ